MYSCSLFPLVPALTPPPIILPSPPGAVESPGLEEQGCSSVLLHALTLGHWAKHRLVYVQRGAEGSWLSQQGLNSVGVGAVSCDDFGACCLLQAPSGLQSTGFKGISWGFWAPKYQSYLVVILWITPWV